MAISKIERILKSYCVSTPDIRLAYLFGSQATGHANKLSDIDTAFLLDETSFKRPPPYGREAAITSDLMRELKTNAIDVVLLNRAPLFLRHRILSSGKAVYAASENERLRFETYVMGRYPDIKRLLAPHLVGSKAR